MNNVDFYDWFKNLDPAIRKEYINSEFPKWNPDNWFQMNSWQIKQIKRKIDDKK